MSFRDHLNEAKVHKVTNKEFEAKKFQGWIEKDLGAPETSKKIPSLTIYNNKAGKPVFSYNNKKEKLTVIQNGLKLQDLVMYGLNVSSIVKPLSEQDELDILEGIVKELEKEEFRDFKKKFLALKHDFHDLSGMISIYPTLRTLNGEYKDLLLRFEKFNKKYSLENDMR